MFYIFHLHRFVYHNLQRPAKNIPEGCFCHKFYLIRQNGNIQNYHCPKFDNMVYHDFAVDGFSNFDAIFIVIVDGKVIYLFIGQTYTTHSLYLCQDVGDADSIFTAKELLPYGNKRDKKELLRPNSG